MSDSERADALHAQRKRLTPARGMMAMDRLGLGAPEVEIRAWSSLETYHGAEYRVRLELGVPGGPLIEAWALTAIGAQRLGEQLIEAAKTARLQRSNPQ